MSKKRPYNIWYDLKNRCNDIKHKNFKDYGGRGITYDKKWIKFNDFWEDVKDGYSDNLSIDRIDNNGNYCKENCKWSDNYTQNNNTSRNHKITFNGKTLNLVQWAKEFCMDPNTLFTRLKRGWTIKDSLTRPICKKTNSTN